MPRATCADDAGVCLRNGIGLQPFAIPEGFVRDFDHDLILCSYPVHHII